MSGGCPALGGAKMGNLVKWLSKSQAKAKQRLGKLDTAQLYF
jgi:hypothetical protein